MGLLARSLPEAGLGLGGPLPFHAGSIVASAATVDAAARPAAGSRASRAGTAARPAAAAPAAALVLPPGVASAAPSGDVRAASGSGRARSRAVQDAIDRGAVPHTEDPRYFGVSPAICWCFNQGICKNAVSDGVCFFGRHICAQCHSRDHTDCARRGATGAGAELSGGGGTHSGGSGAPIAAVPASASSGLGRGPPAAKSDRPPLGIFPPGVARPRTRSYTSVRCLGRCVQRPSGQDSASFVPETRSSTPTGSTSAASNPERRVSTATAVAHAQDPRSIPAGSSFAASTPERPPSTSAAATAPARAPARIRKQPLAPPFDTTVPTYPTSAVGGATLPPGLAPTPVNLPNLLAALTDHPDPTLAARLSQGFTHGFPLLYRGPPYSAVHRPHPTALEHLDAVRADVAKERAAGRMAGPFPHPPFAPFVASPLGAVPKKRSNPPKWRRITDLSYPRFRGFSVNRGIDNAPLHYTSPSVADAIELIITLGRLTQLGKADVRDAFRLLPVRPEDYWLLGAALPSEDPTRPGEYDFYYDMALPFGGRSSPRTFEDLGQALDHVLRRAGVLFLRYVDDILVLGRPGTAECAQSMEALQAICSHLGIPLAAEKLEGPAFRLVFLGVELDTEAMEARLSAGRYEDLVSLLGRWEGKRHATRHDLQSLAGLLTSATAVIPPGRFFLQRVLSLISALRADHHRATLHPGFHADLRWWRFLLAERHGVRLLPTSARWADSRELRLETDASGVGFGAVFGDAWLFGAWADHSDIPASMPWRELMAIVIAATTWGPQWYRRRIHFHTDCEPVALAIANGYSPRPGFAALLRTLYALSVLHSFEFRATHIAGLSNVLADPLSRLQIEQFRRLHHTRRSYSYPQREFIEFCLQRGLHNRQGSVLPASETTLCFFAAHLFRRGGVAPPSIRTYITAVQSLHVDSGFSTFWGAMPRLARLLEGIARVADPRPKLRRDPITRGQLSALAQYAAAHPSPETRLLWAAFATAFFGFFRCSEVCAVRLPVPDPARLFQRRDLRFFVDEGERFARLHLKKSKTDQRGQGCDVDIPHVGGPECAHCALEALAASWTGPARPDAYVFAHADSGQPLTRSELHAALRNWLRALGYAADPLLPHSFRIGAATAAFEAGLPDYAIQLLGRWRSDAFQLYIRARPELVRRQRGLLLTSGSTPPAT
eukprot:tig00000145_g8839.t1